MWWATSNGNKKEIDKEDVMEALSLCGDSIKGEHFFPICEPFFQSRIKFVTDLENRILKGKSRVTFLTGDPGCGKTNIVSFWRVSQRVLLPYDFMHLSRLFQEIYMFPGILELALQ